MGRSRLSPATKRIPRSRIPLSARFRSDPGLARRWGTVVVLAAVTTLAAQALISDARSSRDRWGETVPVLVTTGPLAPGDEFTDKVEIVDWPAALVPAGVVEEVPPDARSIAPLGPGLPVTEDLYASGAGVEPDPVVAFPWGRATLEVSPGDRVDIWSTVDPAISGEPLATRRVVHGGTVVTVDESAVAVAVAPDEVAEAVEAVALATLTVVQVA